MGHCTHLAIHLDIHMLHVNSCPVLHEETVSDANLPLRTGAEVAAELGGRHLLRYLRSSDVEARTATSPVVEGLDRRTWVTPTPFSPEESSAALALPFPEQQRTYVVFLNPSAIAAIQGPRRVLNGGGIEYLLPDGYPADALAFAWELEVK